MKTLALIALAIALATAAVANELAVSSDLKTGLTCLEIGLDKALTDQVGLFAYAAQVEDWHEFYVGPTWTPADWCQIGLGAGIESGQENVRFGGFLWTGYGPVSLLAMGEEGGSGPWYRVEERIAVDTKTTIGVLQEKFLGNGFLVERRLDRTVTLRVRLYDGGQGDVGLKLTF